MRTWLLLIGREKWLKKGLKLLNAVNPQASHNPKFLLVKSGIHGDSLSRSWGFRHIGRAKQQTLHSWRGSPNPAMKSLWENSTNQAHVLTNGQVPTAQG